MRAASSQKLAARPSPAIGSRLQRKCACGRTRDEGDERCSECRRGALQRRTSSSDPNDPCEREADRVAADAFRSPGRNGHRVTAIRSLPDSQADPLPTSVEAAVRRTGRPLDAAVRADMEQRFAYDFSRVRVHTDALATESALDVGAQAYTVGQHVVFGGGRYAPATGEGRQLIAHELTHVVQQSGGTSGRAVQRKPEPAKKPGADKPKPTAASAPRLDVTPSKTPDPCACLMVVHNDEANARKTAKLIHEQCSYNLALVEPNTGRRLIRLPGRSAQVDPNSMFDRDVAERCLDGEPACRDFVRDNAAATDPKTIEQVAKTQFFLGVDDCSAGFSLPVVVLHNNDIEDTKNYLKKIPTAGTDDLRLDIDKTDPDAGADQVKKLKDLIRTKFGKDVAKELQTPHKTNIFRWCVSSDLSRCHIGDPDHPDNITWVTNQRDFDALQKQPVNVVLQSEAPASKKSESEGDLSSLFPILRSILTTRLPQIITALEQQRQVDWDQVDAVLDDLQKIIEFGDATFNNVIERLLEIVRLLTDIVINKAAVSLMPGAMQARIDRLRFVNVESPGKRLADQTDAERIRNYESIVQVLKAVGLHCCGKDPQQAEARVKEGLKTT
jgi:hypothetical protein